jgi:hypothetical protein
MKISTDMKTYRELKLIEVKISARIINLTEKILIEAGSTIKEKKAAISQINIMKMRNILQEEILSKKISKRMINIITTKTRIVRDINIIMIIILRIITQDRINREMIKE